MATKKKPLPDEVDGAITRLEKVRVRVREAEFDLTQAIRLARQDEKMTRADADAVAKKHLTARK